MHSFREYLYFLWKKASEKQSRKNTKGIFMMILKGSISVRNENLKARLIAK